jgi:hypothetical protein
MFCVVAQAAKSAVLVKLSFPQRSVLGKPSNLRHQHKLARVAFNAARTSQALITVTPGLSVMDGGNFTGPRRVGIAIKP